MNGYRSSVDAIARVRLQYIRKGRVCKMAKAFFVTGYRCVFYGRVNEEQTSPPIIHTNDDAAKDGGWHDLDTFAPSAVRDMLKAFVALGVIRQEDMDEQLAICEKRSQRQDARCKRNTITRELKELGLEMPRVLDSQLRRLGNIPGHI